MRQDVTYIKIYHNGCTWHMYQPVNGSYCQAVCLDSVKDVNLYYKVKNMILFLGKMSLFILPFVSGFLWKQWRQHQTIQHIILRLIWSNSGSLQPEQKMIEFNLTIDSLFQLLHDKHWMVLYLECPFLWLDLNHNSIVMPQNFPLHPGPPLPWLMQH